MFAKLFESMYDGSLATRGPWQALVTFQQLLVLCDQRGVIDMTPEAISRRTTIPVDIINEGLRVLEQPDPESRRGVEEGRRILRLDDHRTWGWQIVNYMHYRSLRTAEERREYMRNYKRQQREEAKKGASQEPLKLPDWMTPPVVAAWDAWMKVRGEKRAPNTAEACQLALAELGMLKAQGYDPLRVLEQSTRRGYTDLFPTKGPNGTGTHEKSESPAEIEKRRKEHRENYERILRESEQRAREKLHEQARQPRI